MACQASFRSYIANPIFLNNSKIKKPSNIGAVFMANHKTYWFRVIGFLQMTERRGIAWNTPL